MAPFLHSKLLSGRESQVIIIIHCSFNTNRSDGFYDLYGFLNFLFYYRQFFVSPFAQHIIHLPPFGEIITYAKAQPGILIGPQQFLYAFKTVMPGIAAARP